ncbi:hypothetical protein ACGYLA_19160 [Sulfitobacter sp. 1A13679]
MRAVVADDRRDVRVAESVWPEGGQPMVLVEQDAIGVGRSIDDPRFVAVGGETDIGMGDMDKRGVETLLAVPSDVGPRRWRFA